MEKIMPYVSVVLPVYNRPTVISTIESILQQTYSNFELLIIDNCSTDNTVSLINETFNDERIKIFVNEKNMGQTYSIKKGFALASGKYIARIDADDIACPERLEQQVDFLEKNEDYGFCGSWVQFITDDDKKSFIIKTCQTDKGFRFLQTICCGMYHPALMVRKAILDKYSITYDENLHMAEDYNLWNDLLAVTKGGNIPQILLYYRRGANNDSKTHAALMKTEYFSVRKIICSKMSNKDDLLKIIDIEMKKNRTLFDFIKVFNFYKKYLNQNIEKSNVDYVLIKKQIRNHVITSFLTDNTDPFFIILFRIYKAIRELYYKTRR